MGGVQSNVVSETAESVNEAFTTFSVSSTSEQLTKEEVTVSFNLTVSKGSHFACSSLKVAQSETQDMWVMTKLDQDLANTIQNNLNNKLDSLTDQKNDTEQGFLNQLLNTFSFHGQSNVTDIKTRLNNVIKNNTFLKNTTIQQAFQKTSSTIDISAFENSDIMIAGACDFSQGSVQRAQASIVATALLKAMSANMEAASQTLTTKEGNKTLDSLFGPLPLGALIAIAAGVVLLIVVGGGGFLLLRHHQGAVGATPALGAPPARQAITVPAATKQIPAACTGSSCKV